MKKSQIILIISITFIILFASQIQSFVGKATQTSLCSDSDGGKNYYIKGAAELTTEIGGATLIDSCCIDKNDLICDKQSGSVVNEAYCRNDNTPDAIQYECPNGCKDGACIKEQLTVEECVDTTWMPRELTVCKDEEFTQTSNCERTRTATGIKTCLEGYTCSDGQCIQKQQCVDTIWSPDPSTKCQGTDFFQISNCNNTRTATGTKTTSECAITQQCIDTCSSLGYKCGTHTICRIKTDCGTCLQGYDCISSIKGSKCIERQLPIKEPIAPTTVCQLTNAYWSTTSVQERDIVGLIVEGTNCDGEKIIFDIREGEVGADTPITSLQNFWFSDERVEAEWRTEYINDGFLQGNPEYYFTAYSDSDSSIKKDSNKLTVMQQEQFKCTTNLDCPSSHICKEEFCIQDHFKMAFILLAKNNSELTNERLNAIENAKEEFSTDFHFATNNLGYMDTSYNIVTIIDDGTLIEPLVRDGGYKNWIYPDKVTKKFYETNPDIFDFISIYTTFDTDMPTSYFIIKNNIIGIAELRPIYDNTKIYGSDGRLIGVNLMGSINSYIDITSDPSLKYRGLLHETGHQWCCYVGDNFAKGANNAQLEIIKQGIHFYNGLESPYETVTPMNSDHWISNNDGTYRVDFDPTKTLKYHPFQLYFMGLLPEIEYNKKYKIYNAGIIGQDYNSNKGIFYKEVSVSDIIAVEGERIVII